MIELADLTQPLGFFGNYIAFPLREPNVLTRWMMVPFVDRFTGTRDAEAPLMTVDELDQYAEVLKSQLSDTDYQAVLPKILELRAFLLSNAPDDEEIVVPTGSLFIDALPGTHPVLETYKLQARALDLQKETADVARAVLENQRLQARLSTNVLGDPDAEKEIIIEGATSTQVVTNTDA